MGALEKGMDVKELAEHARNGNSMSSKVFEEFGKRLAEMLKSYVVDYQPNRIVIGGQIAKSIDLFGPALQTGLADSSIIIFTSENVSEYTLIGISRLFDNSFGLK
ncbi:ROK family protein [Acinetobacter sp. CUI P1]|nr:ROK family protein [Acinetobacter sp. CUI P1]